jgi:hypothetical protein
MLEGSPGPFSLFTAGFAYLAKMGYNLREVN